MTRNRIVEENKLPGAPSTEWDVNGWGDPSIQGFGHDISIDLGETIFFKIRTDSTDYRIDIYRMGWYAGLGARLVDTVAPSVPLPQSQPEGLRDPATHLYDCGNWAVSASWTAPKDAVSGIYFARLVRQDPEPEPAAWRADHSLAPPAVRPAAVAHAYGSLGHGRLRIALREPRASHIHFVVRDDASRSDILFQTADTTWQAYNRYGGHCTYGRLDPDHPRLRGGPPRAYKASYNRPLETRHYRAVNTVFNAEYPFVRFLEANGYDASYTTGVDSDRRGELIRNHRLFLSVGHDEYWSGRQRRNVEAARDAGVHLGFFSGNEVFWKTRFEPSIDESEAPYRTMVTYKETHANAKIDPLPDVWTGTWRDSRPFNPEGPQPENALTGTIFTVNAWRNDPIIVPAEYARLRFWRDTDVARLGPGERAVLLKGLLGHEWDEDLDNGFRPPGLFRLSETTIDNVPYVQDCGSVFDSGTATHHLTLYRHASGALVFGAGTVQWAWGRAPRRSCAGRSTTAATSRRPRRVSPFPCRRSTDSSAESETGRFNSFNGINRLPVNFVKFVLVCRHGSPPQPVRSRSRASAAGVGRTRSASCGCLHRHGSRAGRTPGQGFDPARSARGRQDRPSQSASCAGGREGIPHREDRSAGGQLAAGAVDAGVAAYRPCPGPSAGCG